MALFARTTLACAIDGDDLVCVALESAPWADRVAGRARIERFLDRSDADLAGALADAGAADPARVTLVAPAGLCAVRPVAMTVADWSRAKDEALATLDQMIPLRADDAMVGLVNRYPADGDEQKPTGGAIVGVRRSAVAPWTDRLRAATGAQRVDVLAPHMAVLGLGLQTRDRVEILDRLGPVPTAHRLRDGLPTALDERPSGDAPAGRVTLAREAPGDEGFAIDDLALAGALAGRVAPGAFAPLDGGAPSPARRWLAPAAAVALAAVMALAAGPVYRARLAGAAESAQARRAELAPVMQRVSGARTEAEAFLQRTAAVDGAVAGWSSVLPTLADVHRALDDPGFLYRVQITPDSVSLAGETASEGRVLERLESSPTMRDAAFANPVTTSPSDESLNVFSIRAQREGSDR